MILVTGAGGLLGSWLCRKYEKETIGFTHQELDICDYSDVEYQIKRIRPEVVINCAGSVPKSEHSNSVNYIGTANLLEVCSWENVRLIHVSTDCVFSGKRGKYSEEDIPDNQEPYGYYKRLGEVTDELGHLTIRTSFVGWPDPKGRGLLAWLYQQSEHKTVEGWINHYWNGLTVNALCDYLMEFAYSKHTGLIHLHGQRISKYELLRTAADVFNWQRNILPITVTPVDRTLKSVRGNTLYIPGTYNFRESCMQMKREGERLWAKASA